MPRMVNLATEVGNVLLGLAEKIRPLSGEQRDAWLLERLAMAERIQDPDEHCIWLGMAHMAVVLAHVLDQEAIRPLRPAKADRIRVEVQR